LGERVGTVERVGRVERVDGASLKVQCPLSHAGNAKP
jgi:hypothetical protein